MTATMTPQTTPEAGSEKGLASGRKGAAVPRIAVSGDPSVQLLPPSIRDRAAARSRMRTGVLLVILGLLIAIAVVAAGSLRAGAAHLALIAANNRTAQLLSEQAQYADAVRVSMLVDQIKELELGATANEVAWADLFGELQALLPAGSQLMDVNAVGQIPWEPVTGATAAPTPTETTTSDGSNADAAAPVATPVAGSVIAVLDITVTSTTLQDGTTFLRGLATLRGYQFAVIRTAAVGTDGLVTTTITLQLNIDAASGRFLAPGASGVDADSSAGSEG